MNKIIVLIISVLLISTNLSKAQNIFNKRYDIEKGAEVTGKMIVFNSKYIITGRSIDSMNYYVFPPPNAKIGIIGIDINGQNLFSKRYGSSRQDYGSSWGKIVEFNNCFYLNGTCLDSMNIAHHYLFKFNAQGDSLLLKHYFENDTVVKYWGSSCKISRDSNLVLCGVVDSSSFNNYSQIYIMKTDTLGSILWTKTYGGSHYESCTNMDTCSDGGFILGGWTTSYGGNDKDPYIVKTDSNGNFEWHKTINSNSENDWPAVVISTSDSGILAVTTEVQYQEGSTSYTKLYFNKYNLQGNLLWRKSIGDTLYDASIFTVKETADGDFVAVATAKTHNHLIKLNANGDSIFMHEVYRMESSCSWQDQYGFDMAVIDNGGIAIAGFVVPTYPGSNVNNSQDAWLSTYDSLGCQLPNKPYNLTVSISFTANDTIIDLQWDYNASSIHEQFVVQRYIETSYAWDILHMDCIANGYQGYIPIPYDYYKDTISETLKTKYRIFAIDTVSHLMSCHSNVVSIDLTNAIAETEQEEILVKVYPNPAAESFTVAYDFRNMEDGIFHLYSMDGKLLIEKHLKTTARQTIINSTALYNGIYFYTVYSNGSFITHGKIVLVK